MLAGYGGGTEDRSYRELQNTHKMSSQRGISTKKLVEGTQQNLPINLVQLDWLSHAPRTYMRHLIVQRHAVIPSHARQEGNLHYLSPLKVFWFAICSEGRQITQFLCILRGKLLALIDKKWVRLSYPWYITFLGQWRRKTNMNADNSGGTKEKLGDDLIPLLVL